MTYTLGRRSHASRFAPVATAVLTGLGGATALLLVTPEAERHPNHVALRAELEAAGLTAVRIPVNPRGGERAMFSLLEALMTRIPQGSRVTLDITLALRHLPFVYNAALTYLTGLRDVRIGGIYYGAFELRRTGTDGALRVPLTDISATVRLVEWYQALRALGDSGDSGPLAKALSGDVAELFRSGRGDVKLGGARDAAKALAGVLRLGLPLEAGNCARGLIDAMSGLPHRARGAFAARHAAFVLNETVRPWALPERVGEKRAAALDRHELVRQLRFARWYSLHGDLARALTLLREWMVSAAMLSARAAPLWLDRESREGFARRLNGLTERSKFGLASPREKRVQGLWDAITSKRNPVAHCGMQREDVRVSEQDLMRLIERCEDLMRQGIAPPRTGRGVMVITALGLSPGVLYSAVKLLGPKRMLVFTSPEASPSLAEALRRSRWRGEIETIELTDPFAFRGARVDALAGMAVRSAEAIANLTGGTTALQWAVEEAARGVERLGVPVRRVAIVDRRSRDMQSAEPYVIGDLLPLDHNDDREPG